MKQIKIYSDVSIGRDNSELTTLECKSTDFVIDLLTKNNFSYFSVQVEGNYFVYVSIQDNAALIKTLDCELCYVYDDFSESLLDGTGFYNSQRITLDDLIENSKYQLDYWKKGCQSGNEKYDLEQYKTFEVAYEEIENDK